MKSGLLRSLGIVAVLCGLGVGASTTSAHAKAYHAVSTKSYASTTPVYRLKNLTKSAYMWNGSLTKKLHNLKNYPATSWYVQKSVKLTNGSKTGIFYYVRNKNNSVRGLV